MAATHALIVPGIGNSSPAHWQSLWQETEPALFSRIALPADGWEEPRRREWVSAISEAVAALGSDTILIAHSLGCLAVAHWAADCAVRIRGALLVSPPDPDGPDFPRCATGFSPMPWASLPFPSILVASANDPFLTSGFARRCARYWGSRLHEIGDCGHLGDNDGLGAWPLGRGLFESLRDGR